MPGFGDRRQTLDIIGVVKDFNFFALKQDVYPHAFIYKPEEWDWGGYISVRLDAQNIKPVIDRIESVWVDFTDNIPMQYFLMDKEFESLYSSEKRITNLALSFTIFSLIIAGLGLFGLTAFSTEQRTKEIGIRKVMGASVSSIVIMLLKELLLLILISAFFAWPITTLLMEKWFQNFYYRIHPSFINAIYSWLFREKGSVQGIYYIMDKKVLADLAFSLIIAMLIAFLTMSYKAIKAAKANPVISLRYE